MITTDGPSLLLGGGRSWVRIARVPGSPGDRFWRVEGRHPCLHADFVVRLARHDVLRFADALLAGLGQRAARQIGITTEPQNPLTVSLCRCDDEPAIDQAADQAGGGSSEGDRGGGGDATGEAAVAAFAMITPSGADQTNHLTMELAPQPVARLASALTEFRQALGMTATTVVGRPDEEERPNRVRAFLRLVMIEHSVFALPFAYIASLSACYGLDRHIHWLDLVLVTIAMVGARTFAMAMNRIIDREIDARNPRTANRELVTGALSMSTAWTGALAALAVFLAAAAALNTLALLLAPLAVVPMVVYPYGKRFTNVPHALLGLAQAVGPVGAWIAMTGRWSWQAVLLGLAVGTWIGGFDLIFGCQDVAADRAHGVRSVPARWGIAVALYASRVTHAVTLGLFVAFGLASGAGVLWWVGLFVVAAAFCYEHSLVRPHDLSRLNRAFFTVNGFVGIALFCFALADLLARGLRP